MMGPVIQAVPGETYVGVILSESEGQQLSLDIEPCSEEKIVVFTHPYRKETLPQAHCEEDGTELALHLVIQED